MPALGTNVALLLVGVAAFIITTVIKLVALNYCYCKNLYFSGLEKHPSRDQGMWTIVTKTYCIKLDCKTLGLMSSNPNKLCHEIAVSLLK